MLVNIYEAKTKLSNLIESAIKGEEIVIGKNGVPMVVLTPFKKAKKKRVLGQHKNVCVINGDINAPMDDEFMENFE
jgi:prevent-host-death family protein